MAHLPVHLRGARARRALAAALLLGPLAALHGCLDNPACIFGGDCSTTASIGVGSNPATFPVTGQWIRSGDPSVEQVFPSGNMAQPNTPVVIVFSESMSPDVTPSAFGVFESTSGIEVPTTGELVGDGRVLVLLPGAGLGGGGMSPLMTGSTYEVRLTGDVGAYDLTGQDFTDGDGLVGSFTVANTPATAPSVLATWPLSGATDGSSITEVVVVFDGPVLSTTVTAASLFVTVDAVPPQTPPVAFTQLTITAPLAPPTPEPRVWTWRNEDTDGNPVPLLTQVDVDMGAVGLVDVTVSPAMAPIQSFDMMSEVASTTVSFTVQDVFLPVDAAIMSQPMDAIGIRNLVDAMGGPGDLALDVTLERGLTNDALEIWLFGVVRDADNLPFNAAFVREVILDADMDTLTLTEDELDVAPTLAPLTTIVEDGDLGMAFRLRRGAASTPVFVLDVDPATDGVQDPTLDITPPELVGLGSQSTAPPDFRSDQRHMTLYGTASEELRQCDVTVTIGAMNFDNGTDTPVLRSGSDGTFLAAPVMLPAGGVVDPTGPPPAYTAVLRDRALNATAFPVVGNFVQVGSTAPGTLVAPGGMIEVEVVDARDLTPIENALVVTHQDDSGTVTPIGASVTGANGTALVTAAAVGETIVTIDATGHDLFTFHGVTTTRLSVPLTRAEEVILTQASIGVSTTPGTFSALESRATDSRIDPALAQAVDMGLCFVGPTGLEGCTGSPFIRNGVPGNVSGIGVVLPSGVGTFNAQSFLRAFAFEIARPAINLFGGDAVNLELDGFLNDPGVPDEELPIEWLPRPSVETAATTGIDLGMLIGNPSVLVQANVPGLPGPLSVGLGVTFDDMMGGYDLRAAYPGVADPVMDSGTDALGQLVQRGVIESELRLRVELTEAPAIGVASRRAGARPTLSSAPGLIFPLGVPNVISPLPLQMTGPAGFDVVFDGVIHDQVAALGKTGLYKVTLTGTNDREWVLWRRDQGNLAGQPVRVHAPDISMQGGAVLPDSDIAVRVSAFAWPGFDPTDFLWADVEREYDLFAHSLPGTFNN